MSASATEPMSDGPIPAARTPDDRFRDLPGYPFEPHYIDVGRGLRMHYVDEGEGDPILCLHGEPSWSYLYRKMIPILAKEGRVIAPDLIGFGKSDKPTERDAYSVAMHLAILKTFVDKLDLKRVTLVCQDWGGLLGLPLATDLDDRFSRLVIMNTGLPTGRQGSDAEGGEQIKPESLLAFLAWRSYAASTKDMDIARVLQSGTASELGPEVLAAYAAPFPDASYKAGAHVFPLLVPIRPDDPASKTMRDARTKLKEWKKPALVLFSDKDPITAGGDKIFRAMIPSAKEEPEIVIHGAGHFLQEDKGEEIADHIVRFLHRRPIP